jgi:hypothetical protein
VSRPHRAVGAAVAVVAGALLGACGGHDPGVGDLRVDARTAMRFELPAPTGKPFYFQLHDLCLAEPGTAQVRGVALHDGHGLRLLGWGVRVAHRGDPAQNVAVRAGGLAALEAEWGLKPQPIVASCGHGADSFAVVVERTAAEGEAAGVDITYRDGTGTHVIWDPFAFGLCRAACPEAEGDRLYGEVETTFGTWVSSTPYPTPTVAAP